MKERPILMSAPMVRALLDGTKTQTRRAVRWPKPRADDVPDAHVELLSIAADAASVVNRSHDRVACPYGVVGDRLWVRESWRTTGDDGRCDDMPPRKLQPHPVWYEADGNAPADQLVGKLRPSLFMPRWASRILLEVTEVHVERLQEISERDCCAEGVGTPITRDCKKPKYAALWESINGAGSWDANPWVWAIAFTRL